MSQMSDFLNNLVSGVVVGAVDALVALAILLLYKATGMFNFAQGSMMTLGAYFAIWAANQQHWPLGVSYLFAVVALLIVGVILERVAVAPLRGKRVMAVVIVTFGAAYVIQTVYEVWQGTNAQYLASPFGQRNVRFAGIVVSDQDLLIVAVCALVIGAMLWVFGRTPFGRSVRALAGDRETARLYGVSVGKLSALTWGLSAGLTGLAAILIAPVGAVDPTFGQTIMLNAFAAATLGGFGSVGGAMAGGLLIGIAQQVGGAYTLGSAYGQAWPYLIMIVAIALRPQGLFAGGAGERL